MLTLDEEVEAFLVVYRKTFETLQPEQVAAYYTAPFFGINRDGPRTFPSSQDVLDNFVRVMNDFRAAEIARLEYEVVGVHALSSSIVHADVRWRLMKKDGSLVKPLRVVYVLWRSPHGLRIACVYTID